MGNCLYFGFLLESLLSSVCWQFPYGRSSKGCYDLVKLVCYPRSHGVLWMKLITKVWPILCYHGFIPKIYCPFSLGVFPLDQGTYTTLNHEGKHCYPEGTTIVMYLGIYFFDRIGSQCINNKMGIDTLLLVLIGWCICFLLFFDWFFWKAVSGISF